MKKTIAQIIIGILLLPCAHAQKKNDEAHYEPPVLELWKIHSLLHTNVRVLLSMDGKYSATTRRSKGYRMLYNGYGKLEMKASQTPDSIIVLSAEDTFIYKADTNNLEDAETEEDAEENQEEQTSYWEFINKKKKKQKRIRSLYNIFDRTGGRIGAIWMNQPEQGIYFDADDRRIGFGNVRSDATLLLHPETPPPKIEELEEESENETKMKR